MSVGIGNISLQVRFNFNYPTQIAKLIYQHFYGVSVTYLYNFQSKVFISYFIHHKPVIYFLDYDNSEDDIDLQNLCLVPGDLSK